MGLGLTLGRKLCEAMEGTLTCTSEGLGKGSTFELCIPVKSSMVLRRRTSIRTGSGGKPETVTFFDEKKQIRPVADDDDAAQGDGSMVGGSAGALAGGASARNSVGAQPWLSSRRQSYAGARELVSGAVDFRPATGLDGAEPSPAAAGRSSVPKLSTSTSGSGRGTFPPPVPRKVLYVEDDRVNQARRRLSSTLRFSAAQPVSPRFDE